MKLTHLILEARDKPKLVVMAGGAGTGKSYLLNQLDLGSLHQVNPDKYVEDPDSPAFNKLTPGVALANKEAEALADEKTSFVWDTTASNASKIQLFLNKGYDVYMVMVYTHPMIAYISNFSRNRNVPKSAVFSTWNNVYDLIDTYNKMLKGNLSIFVNTRGGEFEKEVKGFDAAAKNGAAGISDYIERYNKANDTGKSSFRQEYEMSDQEKQEFYNDVKNVDYDTDDYSEDRALKKYFTDWYRKNGVGPGDDKMNKKVASHRKAKDNATVKQKQTLDDIAGTLYDPTFQEKLKHSTPAEIDSRVQNFLA
tara:strand:+ start:566 stop:1492 length:927 start_codon:yes stop_codon:yes gene_type:complete